MHWLDILILILLAWGVLRGFQRGLIKSVIHIVSGLTAWSKGWYLASWMRTDVLPLLDMDPSSNRWVVLLISFLILYNLLYFGLTILTSFLRIGPLKLIDHLLGALAGLVISIYALGYVFAFADSIVPYQRPAEGEPATGIRSTSRFYEPIRHSITDLDAITAYFNYIDITEPQ